MQIPCSRAQAMFADPGIRLARHTPGFMVWDEHGGTFVLRVEELAATEVAAGEPESGIILEIPLSLPEELIRSLEEFAAQQQLPLAPPSGPEPAGGCRPGGLSPAGPEPVRLCRRAAPGSQKTRRGRGTGARRRLQGPAGPLPGNRPGHSPHPGRHGPVGGPGAQPGPGRFVGGPAAAARSCTRSQVALGNESLGRVRTRTISVPKLLLGNESPSSCLGRMAQ